MSYFKVFTVFVPVVEIPDKSAAASPFRLSAVILPPPLAINGQNESQLI